MTLATDGSNLYVYANVQDDVPTENSFHSALAWKGDSLMCTFGPAGGGVKSTMTTMRRYALFRGQKVIR